jgi:hypothetical protein
VTVEHVHVHSGGQAVVGLVEPAGGRGSHQAPRPATRSDVPRPSQPRKPLSVRRSRRAIRAFAGSRSNSVSAPGRCSGSRPPRSRHGMAVSRVRERLAAWDGCQPVSPVSNSLRTNASSVVEVAHRHRHHSQEQRIDRAKKHLLPPKASAKLVGETFGAGCHDVNSVGEQNRAVSHLVRRRQWNECNQKDFTRACGAPVHAPRRSPGTQAAPASRKLIGARRCRHEKPPAP